MAFIYYTEDQLADKLQPFLVTIQSQKMLLRELQAKCAALESQLTSDTQLRDATLSLRAEQERAIADIINV